MSGFRLCFFLQNPSSVEWVSSPSDHRICKWESFCNVFSFGRIFFCDPSSAQIIKCTVSFTVSSFSCCTVAILWGFEGFHEASPNLARDFTEMVKNPAKKGQKKSRKKSLASQGMRRRPAEVSKISIFHNSVLTSVSSFLF
jgi:hypothetical protein